MPGHIPNVINIHRHICTSMLIVAVFTTAKFWNQPWCLPTDGGIKKMNWISMTVLFGYEEQNYIICKKIELKTIILHKTSHMTWPLSLLVTSSLRCWQSRDFTAIFVKTTIWHPQEIATPFEFPVTGHSVTHPNPLLSVGFYLSTCLWHHGNRRPLSCDKVSEFPTSLRRPDIYNTRSSLWLKNFFLTHCLAWYVYWFLKVTKSFPSLVSPTLDSYQWELLLWDG